MEPDSVWLSCRFLPSLPLSPPRRFDFALASLLALRTSPLRGAAAAHCKARQELPAGHGRSLLGSCEKSERRERAPLPVTRRPVLPSAWGAHPHRSLALLSLPGLSSAEPGGARWVPFLPGASCWQSQEGLGWPGARSWGAPGSCRCLLCSPGLPGLTTCPLSPRPLANGLTAGSGPQGTSHPVTILLQSVMPTGQRGGGSFPSGMQVAFPNGHEQGVSVCTTCVHVRKETGALLA